MRLNWKFASATAIILAIAACKTNQAPAPSAAGEVTAATPVGTTS